MNVLDLFSGIGGFSLGLERAGMTTVAFCEIEPYCQRVLAKHWPEVPIYDDVRELTADTLRRDGIDVNLICGGFPCQDISVAGKGAGLSGERSGLWFEYRRIVREIRPLWIVIENVPAILARGGSTVVNDLAALGYDCLWECIPASAIGARHRRDRWWCIAYATRSRREQGGLHIASNQTTPGKGAIDQSRNDSEIVSNTDSRQLRQQQINERWIGNQAQSEFNGCEQSLANAIGQRQLQSQGSEREIGRRIGDCCEQMGHPNGTRLSLSGKEPARADGRQSWRSIASTDWWSVEPDVGRVAHGVPSRVDRLRGLGNAVVPQIPELIGRAIMKMND